MKKTVIQDLNPYIPNERNGTYGGKAGDKEGITINGEYWIVKYPKSTKGMRGTLESYTTAPLSEYIGSNIYQILGIETHDTVLGIRNDKLVVACKDFCKSEGSLREIRTLKNIYNKELSEKLEETFSSTSSSHCIDLEDMMVHLKYNPILKEIPDIQTRFWEQFIVDMLINNNDRNNGNWGVLYENGEYRLAPVFDNGASFSNKIPDCKIIECLNDDFKLQQSVASSVSIYRNNGHQIHGKDIIQIKDETFYEVAAKIIPVIDEKMGEIFDFVQGIPEKQNGIAVCSKERGHFYLETMEMKLEQYLMPVLAVAKEHFIETKGNAIENDDIEK